MLHINFALNCIHSEYLTSAMWMSLI